jgi:hypothetical protein
LKQPCQHANINQTLRRRSLRQKATAGGILAIVASVLGALMGLFFLAMPAMIGSMSDISTGGSLTPDEFSQIVIVLYISLGVFLILLGALGLVGGIFSVNRHKFGLALAGAIASSISFYPLGIVAVILVSMAHPEFNRSVTPQIVHPVTPST